MRDLPRLAHAMNGVTDAVAMSAPAEVRKTSGKMVLIP
jgi:hypothetical protein